MAWTRVFYHACLWLLCVRFTAAAFDIGYGGDNDLTSFVTRPEIKVPRLEVIQHRPNNISPGYFFVSPLVEIYQDPFPSGYYQPCQTGPHIYDLNGSLVWTGACQLSNRNVADFRPVFMNQSWFLSAIVTGLRREDSETPESGNRSGYGLIMDSSYGEYRSHRTPKTIKGFNIHDFRVIPQSSSAIMILSRPTYTDVSTFEEVGREAGWVENMGFQEIDLSTGKVQFSWWALDHVQLNESSFEPSNLAGPLPASWDFFHLNSVDKSTHGDYLISARHTDTIYRISGKDKSIQWRLGGEYSNFAADFELDVQRDARFLDRADLSSPVDPGPEYLSVFNNIPEGTEEKSNTSSAIIVALDRDQNVARVIHEVLRPDRGVTAMGGNSHIQPNGNIFTAWGGNGYATEHDSEGRLTLETHFLSDRFSALRMYKSDFHATPKESPTLVCEAFGPCAEKAITSCWISWNGATELRTWRFRAGGGTRRVEGDDIITHSPRDGFETSMQKRGYWPAVYAEALNDKGEVIGRSALYSTKTPRSWSSQEEKRHGDLK